MTLKYFQFKNFNNNHQNCMYFITLGENTFILNVKWNKYCDCATLSMYDYNNNPIIKGRALVNKLYIRNNKLPYIFFFSQKDGKTYEPTLNNIAEEFLLFYDDEVE